MNYHEALIRQGAFEQPAEAHLCAVSWLRRKPRQRRGDATPHDEMNHDNSRAVFDLVPGPAINLLVEMVEQLLWSTGCWQVSVDRDDVA